MALLLKQRGIENVRPLSGGLEAWRRRGFPLEGPEDRSDEVAVVDVQES